MGTKEVGGYIIRPNYQKKFRAGLASGVVREAMLDTLANYEYHPDTAPKMSAQISAHVKTKLKELELDRYKFIVQVLIGEQKGEGAKFSSRCYWDSDTDAHVKEVYTNVCLSTDF